MNRAGEYVKVLDGEAQYFAYSPNPLPPQPHILMDGELSRLLLHVRTMLEKLSLMAKYVPDIALFVGAYVRKEALLSSIIEGTQATLEDVLYSDETTADLDVCDVINYVKAIEYAINRMKTLPLCNRLLCETHAVLMQGVRGGEKNPGEFRHSQNWIGAAGSTLRTARYISPTPEIMADCMSLLEKYIHNDEEDPLIKTALAHYQFETIHPFLDGNGRIGRMLIVLMLLNDNLLSAPILYPSLFFKLNRTEYYDRLGEVRKNGNYEQWVTFFLHGMAVCCENTINSIEKIKSLTDRDEKICTSALLKKAFAYLKSHPILSINGLKDGLGVAFNTAAHAIALLTEKGILTEKTGNRRKRIFEYSAYLDILKEDTL